MKVTLAKTAYEVDHVMKERIERYVIDMQKALDDPEVAQDVEQRIVDILEEQNVHPGQAITSKPMDKVVALMGNPSDFSEADMQEMAVYHKRLSALQIMLRFSGLGLLLAAIVVCILLATALVTYFAGDAGETFPSGALQWSYAVAGIMTMALFTVLSTIAGLSLMQGRLTLRSRRLLKSTGIAGAGMVAVLLVSALLIVISN